MELSTGAESIIMRENNNIVGICRYILVFILFTQSIFSGQLNRTSGLYDLDGDGRKEVLIISSSDRKAVLVELQNESISDTLWSYILPKGTYFTDVSVIDIDRNGQPDLVGTSKIDINSNNTGWLYVFEGTSGGFSEYIRIPSQWAIQCPDGLSTKESMMLGTAGLTAGLAVDSIKNTCDIKDAKVVVSGATGGVGSIGVNLLSHLGAEVTAISGKIDEKRFLKKLGATEIIERNHFIKATKLPLNKGMYNAALDVVGGSMLSSILSSMYQNGIITVCGNVGGPKFETTVFPFILRGNSLVGIDSANSPIDKRKMIWKHFSSDWKLDGLEKYSKIVDLENLIPEIKNILAGKQMGRIILKL